MRFVRFPLFSVVSTLRRPRLRFGAAIAGLLLAPLAAPAATVPTLKEIAFFRGAQVTGVTATSGGRIFANFPRWREGLPYSVVEIDAKGRARPYPNAEWNRWTGESRGYAFTCVQSVVAHGNYLYVVDAANPYMKGVVGQAKLYEFDLATNQLHRVFRFDEAVAPKASYLNDVRFDDQHGLAVITDSGLGALVVLNLETGQARRVLENHPSVKAEDVVLNVNGGPVLMEGKPAKFNVDGIALNEKEGMVYYHALTGHHLYRVPTAALADDSLSEDALAAKVEDLGLTPAPDGMIFGADGSLYLGDLERNAIVARDPAGKLRTVFRNAQLGWADTFAVEPNGSLLVTDSHLKEVPVGQPLDGKRKFSIYRLLR